ncbi:Wzz/FepE/Etk N-terminal domain-containing protein [Thioclava sp. FR2]|uniref:Wzz/FepE/Etk N-terminal domain-containing protein n=1 Tax=Thioclava sp. FR2 TaxID=3445780 RepID=UPI003EBDC573
MGPIQTFEDLIGLVLRRWKMIALITVIGSLMAAWYAKSRPDTFETAAVLQVEQASIVNRTEGQSSNPLQILQTIEQRLTTRENIQALIDRHSLAADMPGLSKEEQILALRSSIRFQSVSSATGGGLSAIIVVAQSGDAENAARIANDLAQSVLDLGSEGKKAQADANYTFFKAEEARLWQELSNLEAEIASYREANRSALPSVREARQDEVVQLDAALRELDQEIAGLQVEESRISSNQTLRATDRRRLEEITQRLAVLNSQRDPILARKAALDQSLSNVAEVDRVLSTYERQLRQLQDQYTVVSQRLAEAETTRRLAENQQTERFSLLERAVIPEYPLGSGGKKLAIAGAVGSVGLALTLAFLLDLLHPAIRTSAQMERELNIRPIVAIPALRPADRMPSGRSMIKSLIESEAGRLRSGQLPGNATILAGASLLLVAMLWMA